MDEGQPMSASGSPFTSSIFSIYAGPTKKHFLVHSTILAKSPTLRAIIDGEWKESANRTIDLEEWDEQTVEQLVQWLYSGHYTWLEVASEAAIDYTVGHRSKPSLVRLKVEPAAGPSPQHPNEAPAVSDGTSDRDKEIYQIPIQPYKIQCHGPRIGITTHDRLVADQRITEIENALQKSAQTGFTLVQDAKVYALAQYLQLIDLKRLAFHNIQDVLTSKAVPRSLPRMTTAIVNLSRYTYAHTDALSHSEEPLRQLVSTFVAMWLPDITGSDVDAMMSEGGDFVVDITGKSRGLLVKLFRKYHVAKAKATTMKQWIEDLDKESSSGEIPGAS